MMIPCLWSLLFGFDALTGVGWKGAPAGASFLVDIPSRWEPRAKQSRTVALLTALCAAALFGSCTVYHKKNPQTEWSGDCGGALSTAVEPLSRHIVAAVRAL